MHKAKKLRTHDKILVLSSNGSNKTKGKMVDWRRNKVQQLLVRGYSQGDVAEELQIGARKIGEMVQQ
jgi:DNA-binding NarL/FixJ family response regulator